jgi:hypothetical protein
MKISIFEIYEQESLRTGHVKIIGHQFGAKFKLVFVQNMIEDLI